jgi:pimeloyl-ACP methyl ester carboxylesterase
MGRRADEVVVAWHGLARTGRDMDHIAAVLAQRFRVICPDTLGRGLSQWSPRRPRILPGLLRALAVSLLDQLGVAQCLWLGTSMGGAIGLRAAAGALRGRIQRLVLNDIGPSWPQAAIERIRTYAGSPPAFATVQELEQYFRTVYKPYGWLSDAQWRLLTETSMRRLPDGRVTPHYDPAMVQQFEHHPNDYAVGRLGRAGPPGAVPARRTCPSRTCCCPRWPRRCAPAARAPWWPHHPRLRPRAGAEHAGAVRAGRACIQRHDQAARAQFGHQPFQQRGLAHAGAAGDAEDFHGAGSSPIAGRRPALL